MLTSDGAMVTNRETFTERRALETTLISAVRDRNLAAD